MEEYRSGVAEKPVLFDDGVLISILVPHPCLLHPILLPRAGNFNAGAIDETSTQPCDTLINSRTTPITEYKVHSSHQAAISQARELKMVAQKLH
jgi:hypothetical protein